MVEDHMRAISGVLGLWVLVGPVAISFNDLTVFLLLALFWVVFVAAMLLLI